MKFLLGSVEVEFVKRAGLISLFNKNWDPRTTARWASMHFLVWPSKTAYYKRKGKGEVVVDGYWIWGRATELYDHNGEYFGLGPLFLMCW